MPRKKTKNIKSEYGNSYKIYSEIAENNYTENLKLRLARRSQEISHQPWAWLDYVSDNGDNSENESIHSNEESVKTGRLKIERNGDDGYNSDETNSNFDASGCNYADKTKENDEIVKRVKQKALEKAEEMLKNKTEVNKVDPEEKSRGTQTTNRPQHPVKGNRKNIRKVQPQKSDSIPKITKGVTNINPKQSNSFVAYGFGAPSACNNQKKTFNVSSQVDVYPSAIRAMQQREKEKSRQYQNEKEHIKQQRTEEICKSAGNRKRTPKFVGRGTECSNKSVLMSQEPSWLSEYQHRFPIYDNDVYRRSRANIAERGLSARSLTPQCNSTVNTCRI